MQNIILGLHLVSAVFLIIVIMSQEKSAGMGSAIAGSAGGGFLATQRGAAKVLHIAGIVLATIYIATAIAYILA